MSEEKQEEQVDWAEYKKERREKKKQNLEYTTALLNKRKIEYQVLNPSYGHYRIGEYDLWATTGKFLHRPTGETGRGIFNLLKLIK